MSRDVLLSEFPGSRRYERHHKGDDFNVLFDRDVVGHYDGLRRNTIELGPIEFTTAEHRIRVWVAADTFVSPVHVEQALAKLSVEEITAAVYKAVDGDPWLAVEPKLLVRRIESVTLPAETATPPKVHRHQWVEHPNWGRGQVEGFVLGSPHDASVRFDSGGLQLVDHSNLTPAVFLGPRWSFEFSRPQGRQQMSATGRSAGTHVQVVVRSGTQGSRALLGRLVVTVEEATELRIVAEKMGATILQEATCSRPGCDQPCGFWEGNAMRYCSERCQKSGE